MHFGQEGRDLRDYSRPSLCKINHHACLSQRSNRDIPPPRLLHRGSSAVCIWEHPLALHRHHSTPDSLSKAKAICAHSWEKLLRSPEI